MIEQLVGDLKATSKQQGIEAKQWNATVSSFLVLLEEKKSLKKERNWSELLAGELISQDINFSSPCRLEMC